MSGRGRTPTDETFTDLRFLFATQLCAHALHSPTLVSRWVAQHSTGRPKGDPPTVNR